MSLAGDAADATAAAAETSPKPPPPLRTLLALAESDAAINSLEADHASLLIKQRFDAARLDALDEPPAWLEGLIAHKRWRQLVYALLEDNPGCLFLQLALRQIQASGFAAEVSARPELCALLGAGISLPEFVESLATQLKAYVGSAPDALDALCGTGSAGEVQMLCCQLLLHAAAHSSSSSAAAGAAGGGASRKRKASSLEPAAAAAGGGGDAAAADAAPSAAAPYVGRLLAEQMATASAAQANSSGAMAARRLQLLALGVPRHSRLMSSLLAVLSSGTASTGDVLNLHAIYCAAPPAETPPPSATATATTATTGATAADGPPPAAPLQLPALLEQLLQSAFHPARPCKPAMRQQVLELLAMAAAHAAPDAESGAAGAGAGAGAGAAAPPDTPRAGPGGATAALAARRARALEALSVACAACERNAQHVQVRALAADAEVLRAQLHEPVVATAVLHWTRLNLTAPGLSGARFTTSSLPIYLQLVGAIVELHPPLRRRSLALLGECLRREPEDASDALGMVQLKQSLLSAVLLLLLRGCALPVLALLHEYLGGADHSLVRHALQQLLRLVAPPFSEAFGRGVLRLLQLPATHGAFRRAGAEAREPLLLCLEYIGRHASLAKEASKLVRQLKAES